MSAIKTSIGREGMWFKNGISLPQARCSVGEQQLGCSQSTLSTLNYFVAFKVLEAVRRFVSSLPRQLRKNMRNKVSHSCDVMTILHLIFNMVMIVTFEDQMCLSQIS